MKNNKKQYNLVDSNGKRISLKKLVEDLFVTDDHNTELYAAAMILSKLDVDHIGIIQALMVLKGDK